MSEGKTSREPLIIQLSNYVKPVIREEINKDWVLNGRANSFFDYIIDRYNGSATNAALIDAYIDRIYGKGLSIKNSFNNASDVARILSILSKKDVRKIVSDFELFGSSVGQIRYGKGSKRTVAKIEHLERKMVAPNKVNKKGEVDRYWVCADWGNTNANPPKSYPAFGTSKEAIEIFEIKPYKAGRTYYADPDYLAGLQYAKLEEEISNFSVNHIMNGLSMGWVMNFNNGIPEEEVQENLERKVKASTTGSNNAGRIIINFNDSKETAPTIEAVPDNANHEQWQFWANEARQQLMVAHRVTTPMLFGIKDNTGLGNNANELKEGSKLLHETTIRPKQNEIIDVLQQIIAVNNISSPLTFIPLEDEEEEKDDLKEERDEIKMAGFDPNQKRAKDGKWSKETQRNSILKSRFGDDNKNNKIADYDQSIEEENWRAEQELGDFLGVQSSGYLYGEDFILRAKNHNPNMERVIEALEENPGKIFINITSSSNDFYRWDSGSNSDDEIYELIDENDILNERFFSSNLSSGYNTSYRDLEVKDSDTFLEIREKIEKLIKNKRLKSKTKLSEHLDTCADELIKEGEDVDQEDWVCISTEEVDYELEDTRDAMLQLASTGTARPNAKSEQDSEQFKVRYQYAPLRASSNSRTFCKKMVNASKIYRKEDIIRMGNIPVNPGWGINGAATYSIWLYKGGAQCHHKWLRKTYVKKGRENDVDVKSPLAEIISTAEARRRGDRTVNPAEVSVRPVDMPNNGFYNG